MSVADASGRVPRKKVRASRFQRGLVHRLELVHSGPAVWAECSCGYAGQPRAKTAEADADGDSHERDCWARGEKCLS